MLIVIKRDGSKAEFSRGKIEVAIGKAMKYGAGIIDIKKSQEIAEEIEEGIRKNGDIQVIDISTIETSVFTTLVEHGLVDVAREYEGYRKLREYQRERSKVDNKILELVHGENEDTRKENANKNPTLLSTQRDLIAGEVSKDLTRRTILPPHITLAHDNGVLRYHDADYSIQKGMINCNLVNLDDMLQNGTVINKKMIEKPKSLTTACTIATQIVQSVAGGNYGLK